MLTEIRNCNIPKMKRYDHLFEKICDIENLRKAHKNAKKGKGWYKEVQEIDKDPDKYLEQIQEMLINHTYRTSEYEVFYKDDGRKKRKIYKLPYFPDRICQWAILQVIEPCIINNLTTDTYSAIPDEEFTKNRPENRLIKTTLKKLQKVTTDGKNKQDARELLLFFDGIQESVDYRQDFAQIRIDRNSREYEKIMKWTEVILQGNSFLNFSDGIKSRSILFAMDEVFENYVACQIKKYFRENWEVSSQDKNYYLFEKPRDFQLRPDIVMKKGEGNRTVILDTKWKSLPDMKNEGWSAFNKKARNDIYQMVTYASRYEAEEIWLLYPKAKYSYQYEGIRDRFETKIYGHTLVIHLFFIDLENMEESMKRLSQGLEDKMAGEVKKYE